MASSYKRIKEQRAKSKAAFERQQKLEESGAVGKFFGGLVGALDFQEDIKADRGLLAKAKRMAKGDSMSREQYNALQRKVGGTKGGFFGEMVDVKGKYADQGYVSSDNTPQVPYFGFLVVVLLGVVGATTALFLR